MKLLIIGILLSSATMSGCQSGYFYNPKNQLVEVEVRFYRDGTCRGTVNGIELPRELHINRGIKNDGDWYCQSTASLTAETVEDYRNIDRYKIMEFKLSTSLHMRNTGRSEEISALSDEVNSLKRLTFHRYRGDPNVLAVPDMHIKILPPKPIGGFKFLLCTVTIQIDNAEFVLNTVDENDESMDIFKGTGYRRCRSIA